MQKIDDFKRKIMSELEKENTISFKNLYSRMNINSYQERSNFLEAFSLAFILTFKLLIPSDIRCTSKGF